MDPIWVSKPNVAGRVLRCVSTVEVFLPFTRALQYLYCLLTVSDTTLLQLCFRFCHSFQASFHILLFRMFIQIERGSYGTVQ